MTVIVIAGAGLQGLLLRRYRLECFPAVRVDSTVVRLTGFLGDLLAPIQSGSLLFGGMDGTAFMACSQAWPKMALNGPRSSTMENSTCWVIGPALTEKVMSPTDSVVAPLKLNKIIPAEWR